MTEFDMNRKYGAWTPIGVTLRGEGRKRRRFILCRCDCGQEGRVSAHDLRTGHSKKCSKCSGRGVRTHGLSERPEYKIWYQMKCRCNDPKNKAYENYGGRGIRVCDRWENSFEAFLEDMGERPGPEYSIDRIDNDKDYEPDNCKWVTRPKQNRNKRNNRMITYRGETKCLLDWAKELGVSQQSIARRLDLGMPVERALQSVNYRLRMIECQGRSQTLKEWSIETGIPVSTLRSRIDKLGWSIEAALSTNTISER